MTLEEVTAGVRLAGLVPGEAVLVLAAQWHGGDALEVTYKLGSGGLAQRVLFRDDEATLGSAEAGGRPFDAAASDFAIVAEAQRITLAGLFDPMLAVATSDVQPLPHQIRAVYGEMLPRTPLRFLLADDPGAGKTIMAGLYIKELLLRDDVRRCLIVVPGGLVEQWQDELFLKFGLCFDLLTPQAVDAYGAGNVFERHPLLIARMDHLARNEGLQRQLVDTEWDLVVVDEAHRMGARYFGGTVHKTKRFLLGERLARTTRHFLLMTATPHSGKEEDFQLFLTLLDRDRFEGRFRKGTHSGDTSGLMRRMVKEDLLSFEGKRLFPERIAETVPYALTSLERDLYEDVTAYVRDGMNRADRLEGKRRTTVGFALTVLQRRLASSSEAIYQSLVRRTARLERRKEEILADALEAGVELEVDDLPDIPDDEEYAAAELEELEDELVDAATASRTIVELDAELVELAGLTRAAQQVRDADIDRKWSELRTILETETLATAPDGRPRKLIIFTEHRDTLAFLERRITALFGRPDAVLAIHGGVPRSERRRITEEFTTNSRAQILLATDAAGEGLNLHAAHLMVNYDLPWNPNRLEQRFGRIHRIGQTEVCHLWNLVASNTREGQVFQRLLDKVDEQRKAYGGKVFDVLGAAFDETPLRDLLMNAIRYGEDPAVRASMEEVIDHRVADGIAEILAEQALAGNSLTEADVAAMRRQMDEARARRLQPHYIELAFTAAFTRLGGRITRREPGRYEIAHVPAQVRSSAHGPISSRYHRVTFDLACMEADGLERADLLAPGHPLHDAVMAESITLLSGCLERGTVLVSATLDRPQLLVGVVEEIVDGTGGSVARRFGYAYVDELGVVTGAGPAPYLDCVAAPPTADTSSARRWPWLVDAEAKAMSWIIAHQLPSYLADVQPARARDLARARMLVSGRLESECERLERDAFLAAQSESVGERPAESSDSLRRKAHELQARLERRLATLDKQATMSTKPPRIVTAALVLPLGFVDGDLPRHAPMHAVATKEVERRGVDLVLACERRLGRSPEEQAFNNPGYDVLSTEPNGDTLRIEVKARIAGADDFFVTHNEVVTGKNAAPRYRLAMVRVDPRGAAYDEVRYLDDPFAGVDLGGFEATGHRGSWDRMWAKGREPH
ncbi:DUF3883 domain-containing protein [Mumia sp. zg.B17]|uniref:helicase-related protein n=1 Tax=Mumia sp. zg.B17 TaxID=2855446 RepID=UPI001C6EACDA|nr:helicase-related protein [Mumia sp. zg.B17]MBW9205356.1 DUF3883 domain-containing protein [Mumia sp. zg.B17]